MNQVQELSKIRSALFPIQNWEMKKFLSMAGLIFFTIFNSTLMRIIKDALIISAPGSGAEVLPFLKLGGVMPLTIIFTLFYVKLTKAFGFRRTYMIVVSIFITFIFLFTFVLYPLHDSLHPSLETINAMKAAYPSLQWVIPAYGVWTYTLYYIFAELWGTFCLSVLFWQFANNTISTEESKRYYPLFVLLGNFALTLLALLVQGMSNLPEESMVVYLNAMIIVVGLCLIYNFWWVNRYVMTDPRFRQEKPKLSKKKPKLSTWESIRQVFQSNYIAYIAMLVLCYGILINIVEVSWKSQVKLLYPSTKEQLLFFGWYYGWLSAVTIILNYLSKGVIRRFGWLSGAITTPMLAGILGSLFFICVLNISHLDTIMNKLGVTPLQFVVGIGAIGVMLSKSAKYSFFDPSKEMAFIPLDKDLRTTGKAAADGIGGRLGKSGGAGIQAVMISFTGVKSILMIANKLAYIVFGLSVVWVWAVFRLNKLYINIVKQREAEQASSQS